MVVPIAIDQGNGSFKLVGQTFDLENCVEEI